MQVSDSPAKTIVGPLVDQARQLANLKRRQEADVTNIISSGDWYDSGWLADSNHTTGIRTYTHNLGLTGPPKQFKLWFSPNQTSMFPVGENRGMGTTTVVPNTAANYHNPSMVQLETNTLIIGVYVDTPDTGMPLFSVYSGSAWANYATGYWRYRIQR